MFKNVYATKQQKSVIGIKCVLQNGQMTDGCSVQLQSRQLPRWLPLVIF